MQILQARLRKLLRFPVMSAEERAEFTAAVDGAQTPAELKIIAGRLMNVGARELHKVADGIEPAERVEGARIRAEAEKSMVPELLEHAE